MAGVARHFFCKRCMEADGLARTLGFPPAREVVAASGGHDVLVLVASQKTVVPAQAGTQVCEHTAPARVHHLPNKKGRLSSLSLIQSHHL